MARTADELLREYIGNQVVQLISLTAEVERLRDEVVKVDNELRLKQDAPSTAAKPNGKEAGAR